MLMDYDQNEVPVKMLKISRQPPKLNGGRNPKDRLVSPTIQCILIQFLAKHPDASIVYICDNNDGLAQARHRLFNNWFMPRNQDFVKYDTTEHHHKHRFYASMITGVKNPQGKYVMDAFYKTLDWYFPDDEQPLICDSQFYDYNN
ncbi:DUF6169 family protein [Chitinophaga sp. sic0106]|uniref:DUF6169 family protein n=1 Tax=Chitinophaga sp. sic0106 TaxID=2854785 RepID=UPI001C46DE74|nr:DUF6169 family protein [Chitinophaga sp. sic0106]MBV7531930.1 hypothetical protein [Chitinophaga sp. sic0106]